jgi:hypothetical protein
MNRFDDLLHRVRLLNAQLEPVRNHIGSEVRTILHQQLWSIVGELNTSLNLNLDNTALDLAVEGDRLVIHYYAGVGGAAQSEVDLFIDRSFFVQKRAKDIRTGKVEVT